MLGQEAFEKAYNYLKKARYEKQNSLDSAEEDIMKGLRKFVKNPSDCFLVDQLLFLEEQAKISKWWFQYDICMNASIHGGIFGYSDLCL